MNSLSLDDQLKIAKAAGHEDTLLTPGKTCVIADGYVFDPTSPDTAIRLMEWSREEGNFTPFMEAVWVRVIGHITTIPEAVAVVALKILRDKS